MRLYGHPDPSDWPSILKRPSRPTSDIISVVQPIFDAVRDRGDEALRDLTHKYDRILIEDVRVPEVAIAESDAAVDPDLRDAISVAADNIDRFHRRQVSSEAVVETTPGVKCWRRNLPIRSVGLYVPGGSAPLVSTVLMLGIPARLAGCASVQLCTPPGPDGRINPAILYAAQVAGIERVYWVGGAQAIAAFAFGTESIDRVDKIFGPGNQFVTAAKQYASMLGIAIDMPAGPTEVAIVADETSNTTFAVYDLLAQAEHGPDSHVVLVTPSETVARQVMSELEEALSTIPRASIAREALATSVCVVVASIDEAIAVCNLYAPEHLIVATDDATRVAEKIEAAGSVFLGHLTPESAGDYASGTNHTLPTGGAARAFSGVSVESFMNKVTFQEMTEEGLRNLGPTIMTLASAEGLDAHGRSVSVRLEALDT